VLESMSGITSISYDNMKSEGWQQASINRDNVRRANLR